MTFQQWIRQAEMLEDKEEERDIQLLVRVQYYGKRDQGWKTMLRIKRILRVAVGDHVTLHLINGQEVEDEDPSGMF